jgi:hypothetical protein
MSVEARLQLKQTKLHACNRSGREAKLPSGRVSGQKGQR